MNLIPLGTRHLQSTIKTHTLMFIFATGDYRFTITVSDKRDDNILTTVVVASLVSPDKESFG